MLQAKPTLGWRDVQEILIRSASKNHPNDFGWANNAAGIHFNHKYGAGFVNAQAPLNLAANWVNLPPQVSVESVQTGLNVAIPDNDPNGSMRTFDLSASSLHVERVTVTVNINHASRGQLGVILTSPGGMDSILAETHGDTGDNYANWTFSTVRNWGENSAGNWTLKITDTGGVTIDASALAGNHSVGGGAIYNEAGAGHMTLRHCTLAGNTAAQEGGAIFNNGSTMNLTHCTVVGNTAAANGGISGGIINYLGAITLTNCIVAANTTGDVQNHSNSLTLLGANLVQTATIPQHATTFDFDGDGVTNGNEWLALTNPGDPTSYLRITQILRSGNNLEVTFPTIAGRTYVLESTTDFVTWAPISASTTPGTGNSVTVTIGPVNGFPRFFLRARVGP